jgi:hypothetical protein
MLISMPTGTSTIFGAFQAILPLLIKIGTTSALGYKVMRIEKFASEIFFISADLLMLQRKRNSLICAIWCQKNAGSVAS